MKINAWFRFCLIALCVVMAASMFACGNKKNDETTTAPVGTTTEATESPSTEAPATEETEAPTTETTEAPTTQTTEAPTTQTTEKATTQTTEKPITQTTEKPTTQTTEKPTTETTEAPTTETTEAPTTETTEAPTTETTEAPVTEAPVEGDFLEFWDKDDLYYDVAFNSSFTVDSTDNGVKLNSLVNSDCPTTFFEGRTAEKENLTATGKYLFMKYKTFTEGMYIQIFTATDKTGPAGDRCYQLNDGKDIFADGKWHLLIIDLTECISAIAPAEDGQYYLQHFRMDFEYEEGVSIEIAYIGLTDEIKDIADYAQATETEDSLKAVCPHLAECVGGTYVDANTHAPVCSLCGTQGESEAHRGATHGVWNAELGYYEATCTVCNGKYNYGSIIYAEAENMTIGQGAWNSAQSNETEGDIGYAAISSKNGAGTWAETYLPLNPAGVVTGQYLVFKYKVPGTIANNTLTINRIDGNPSTIVTAPLTVDDEWHVAIIDLGAKGFDATSVMNNSARINLDGWAAGETIYIDWFRMYDSIDRITLAEADCTHPENAKKNVSIDAENHALSCVICGKQFGEAEAHNITETPDVPAGCFTPGYTGGSSCSDCGYVVEAATATDPVGHKTEDLDGEYCPVCKSFIKADPTTLFNKFIGGKDVPYVESLGDAWSTNGYRVYTKNQGGEIYVRPSFDGSVTGQFMVFKYKATGDMNFEFFQSTVQSGEKAGWSFRYYPSTYDEWQYYIVDLTTVLPADAMVAVDGTYSIKGLRWDVEGTGTAEIAYLAYADSLEKLINGIKALAGDEINEDYCLHSALLNTYESVDDATHALVCALCGKQAVEEHTFDAKAFWNETNARYEASCVLCDGGVEARDWQWSRDYSDYASGHQFGNTGGGNTHSIQDGVLVMTVNGNTAWGGVSVGTGTTIGQYYVLKYRVTEVAEAAETAKIELRFGAIKDIDLIADGEWHVMIIDLAETFGFEATNGLIESTGDHWFLNYKDANLIKYEVAFEGCVDSMDRIPAEYKPAE